MADNDASSSGADNPTSIVHLVDDEVATRNATARLLSASGFKVRTYSDSSEFLAGADPATPGCLVLDVWMPGLSGLDLQAVLADREIDLPIIFLSGHSEIPDSVRAIQRGALDFLTKPVDPAVLLEAVRRALAQDGRDRAGRARRDDLRARYERLTPREREVLQHLISGQLNKQAAADLGIAERTIKIHRARVFKKLKSDSMAELVRLAMELGINPAPRR
jgi:FixJ family two-component response regulator